MNLRQLRIRIEHLEAKARQPVNNDKRAARARWEELRLRRWKHANRPNEGEKPLTEEEEAEFDELTHRFHPLGPAIKAWEEAAARERDRVWSSRRKRPRPNDELP